MRELKQKENKMSKYKYNFSLFFALTLLFLGFTTQTQAQWQQRSQERRVQNTLRQIDVRFENFKMSFDRAIENVRLRGDENNNISNDIQNLENEIRDFKNDFNQRRADKNDAEDLLRSAAKVNKFIQNTRLGARVDRDWASLKTSFNDLAYYYNLRWNWDRDYFPDDTNSDTNFGYGLTGTYTLNQSRSDNIRVVADRETTDIRDRNERERVSDLLQTRLESPERLAIDKRNRTVTIASTRAPQVTFEADGRERTETLDNGRTVRVRTSLNGERLEVSSAGDTGNDYTVTFEPIDNGRSLRVVRRLTTDMVRRPIVVVSVYDKTSDVAQLNIYNGNNNNNNYGGRFIVADGTTMTAVLNESLSTKTAKDGDRFTMTVDSPFEYRGAIIEGYVSNVKRSGTVTGRATMTFNFETIRMRNGDTYSFAGFVEGLKTADGKTIGVNNEGSVKGDSQTKETLKRGAIGGAIGAVIGAIAGGGKGAAIGAIIGGGAGAGTVAIQGKDDIELNSGTEVNIRASAPRS
jgi:hypothetical protein